MIVTEIFRNYVLFTNRLNGLLVIHAEYVDKYLNKKLINMSK